MARRTSRWAAALGAVVAVALAGEAGAIGPAARVIGAGSEVVIELVDWSDKVAQPYLGQRCVAANELWPTGLGGDLHTGRLRCGDDVFTATLVRLKVTKERPLPVDGRFTGAALGTGARVTVVGVRDAVTPPLPGVGVSCVVAERPARRVGPGHVEAMLDCAGTRHEARAVALRVAPEDAALELAADAPELGCAADPIGRWRDCARAGSMRLEVADGPMLERACDLDDAHACRDLGRWVTAYRRETRRELELQARACTLGSRLACFERARARNQSDDMDAWCQEGFAPACRFMQQLAGKKRAEADRWRARACAADPGCGAY